MTIDVMEFNKLFAKRLRYYMEEIQQLAMVQAMSDNIIEQNAKHMYSVYRAYVKAGFIESQAFELTKITLENLVMVEA